MAEQINEKRVTVKGRFIGGSLYEAKKQTSGADKYSALIVLDEGEDAKVEAAIEAAIAEKWNGKRPPGLLIHGVREGDDPEYEHSFENLFINPKAGLKQKPFTYVMRDNVLTATSPEKKVIYPGCYVAASIDAYTMDADKEKSMKACVALSLNFVCYARKGENISGGVNVAHAMEGVEVEEYDEFEND